MLEIGVQPESDPPETVTSAAAKSVESSESEKEREEDSPAFRESTSDEMAMDGLRVSMERVSELLLSELSVLELPAASEKVEEATDMTPSVVLLSVGVKVAV